MSDNFEIDPDKATQQLGQVVIALSRVLAKAVPEQTQFELTLAIEACRTAGYGTEMAEKVLKKAFPDSKPPVFLSADDFAKKVQEVNS